MSFQGPGDTAIHTTQLRCTASLLRHDTPLEEAIETVLEATISAAKGDPRTADWNWGLERLKIARMAVSHVSKNPRPRHRAPGQYLRAVPRDKREGGAAASRL